ncbi:hypothetical protein, partial [Fluviicola sp.]|uniref:hypothetical protein n=1 Tax=Fluviicola sp. TaxID=1917219 RepID=UPI00281EB240
MKHTAAKAMLLLFFLPETNQVFSQEPVIYGSLEVTGTSTLQKSVFLEEGDLIIRKLADST